MVTGGSIGGTIPSSLASFSRLNTVAVGDNCFTGSIPEGFNDIRNMTLFMTNNNNNQLHGSLQGFCEDEQSYREGIGFVARDSNIECSCCMKCDPVKMECSNEWWNVSYPTVYIGDMNAYDDRNNTKQFTKQCISPEERKWIDDECPCIDNTSEHPDVPFIGGCTKNCTTPGAWPSYNN